MLVVLVSIKLAFVSQREINKGWEERVESKKLRIKFSKTGSMKFISHLDLMRYVQKALRRARIDVAYSQGYSPHQLLSFAAPLGLGDTSEGDYLDLQVNTVCEQDFLSRINKEMNDEIRFLRMDIQKEKQKPSMALTAIADYCVNLRREYNNYDIKIERFSEFINQKELVITKKTKRSEKEIDIRPMIYTMGLTIEEFQKKQKEEGTYICPSQTVFEENYIPISYLRLSCGSSSNLKPDLVMEAFCNWAGIEYVPFAFQIHRLETYADIAKEGQKREIVPLWKYQ